MNARKFLPVLFGVVLLLSLVAQAEEPAPLLSAMKAELQRSFTALQHADEVPLYYLAYHVTDLRRQAIAASYGAVTGESDDHNRTLDIDCRVGSHQLDNTHEIRGEVDYSRYFGTGQARLPLEDDDLAIRTIIWKNTDDNYKSALERYTKVMTNQQVLVEREDTSSDFSAETPQQHVGDTKASTLDAESWKEHLRRWSGIFKEFPFVLTSAVQISVIDDNRYFVDSDGALIQTGQSYARLSLRCAGIADDGMNIDRYENFDAASPDELPTGPIVEESIRRIIGELDDLLKAPLAEPYAGPAILVNRASGVFFHEIFGHRIEGHRQKSENEGQTFARKVNERILPDFISVYDDPTLREFDDKFLRGYYEYDDQGVKTEPVTVVENGVLRNFLMSRSPISGFAKSNGHGRKQAGRDVVSRQGNLMIKSTQEHPFDTLLAMMVEQCRLQGKPYGLIFYDISGGFTQTGRYGPQSFKVIPLLVYRYFADGRPMEPIRGVDIVGTPLSSFEHIIATGNDYDIFNGTCGAESGMVPVSAISPSILVDMVEVEKKSKEQDKPPILDPPYQPAGLQ
ncbi:MAG: peptidase U62 [candidate division Zixibacteria bacterium]|nr:peptidase U62 [candidate division Zixibacteria bacterium]